jgi:glycosyltransferase involved in cell wall biosynthesis
MNKLLSIAIPTFNRAVLLDKQLEWLAKAIKGFESECEIIISDNCSTDNTPGVIKKWQSILNNTSFKASRNSKNIGLMPNIVTAIQFATGKYVWTVGDDDPIQEKTLAYLINTLKQNPNTSLVFLNCSGRHKITNKILVKRWFNSNNDQPIVDGKAAFQKYLTESIGGLLFITSAVYKTDLVQQALQQWPNSGENLASQAYWTGFCAAYGHVIVTKEVYVECTLGCSSVAENPLWSFMMRYVCLPKVYTKLAKIGYSPKFCQQMILQNFSQPSDWKILLGALRRWPKLAVKSLGSYFLLSAKLVCRTSFIGRKTEHKHIADNINYQISDT